MQHRTRAKICGITSVSDAQLAVTAGADAIGLVFYRGSPRYVSAENAASIVRSLPAFVTSVGLFVDEEPEDIVALRERVGFQVVQFHGDESPEACQEVGGHWIKAGRMHPEFDLQSFASRFDAARGLLLDAWSPEAPGGTGQQFDWSRVPPEIAGRILLAGGLNAENVGTAIRKVRPYGVDVSSGVENTPGSKDSREVLAFMAAVHAADRSD